jgi:hypothetical protein
MTLQRQRQRQRQLPDEEGHYPLIISARPATGILYVTKIYNELQKGKTVIKIYRSRVGKETVYIPKSIR